MIYKVGTDNIITEATNRLSARLKSKYGEDSVVLVTKNKDGSFETQGDINKLKDNYKVKITGHVKDIGDDATMEGNTQQQIATDLKTILPEHPPRKVSVTGCHSDKCDDSGTSFVSNLKESLQTKGIPTEVEGHKGYVGMNDEGVLMEGDKVPEDRRMMEKGDTTEQEKIELEEEDSRLNKLEEKIRNERVESRKMLRLLEVKLEKAVEKWRDGRRLIYKFRKRLSEIDEELIDARIAIKMFKISKKFKHMEQAQKYFDQQFELRRQTKAEMDKYTTNEEEVSALSQQFTDRHNEHLKEKVALKEVIYAEEENTRQKLENMREDIKKEERQEQGLLAESDKKNKEKLKTTLHALEEEIEAIRQKKRALLKDNLLTKMIGLQRTQTGDELTKSLFEEIKKYREEEVEKWMDKVDSVSETPETTYRELKSQSKRVKDLESEISYVEGLLKQKSRNKFEQQRRLNTLKGKLKKEHMRSAFDEGALSMPDFIFNEVSPLVGVAIEEIDATRDQIENTELKLTEQNKTMDKLEEKFQKVAGNQEAQNADDDNNTLREAAQQSIIRQEEDEAVDELLKDIVIAEGNKTIVLTTIERYDEGVKEIEGLVKKETKESNKRKLEIRLDNLRQVRERAVIMQLNANQEQHEQIQTIKDLKESLKETLTIGGFSIPGRKSEPQEEKRIEAIEEANSKFVERYIKKKGFVLDLNTKGTKLDALKRLTSQRFEEEYTELVVDKILKGIWIGVDDKEFYRDQILNSDNDISVRLDAMSRVKRMLKRTNELRENRTIKRGGNVEKQKQREVITNEGLEGEETSRVAQENEQDFSKKEVEYQELTQEERLAQEEEKLAQEERLTPEEYAESPEEKKEREKEESEKLVEMLEQQYARNNQEYREKQKEALIKQQQQAQENILAEEEELSQPVNFEKYKLKYNNIKVKAFSQAMIRAKIPMSYGGKHAAYHRMVDGKKSSYTMPLHPGTLIDAVYIKILQNELKLNMRTMKSLGVVFNEIDPTSTSSSAKKQASTSSGLQKTHRKTKTQQKTNDKDGDRASGGKSKEQSSTKQDDSANPAIKHNSSLIIQIANDQTANDMQKKITAKQNKQYTTDKVVVVKKNNGKLEITQGQARNLTGNLEVQVIGHGEQVDGINKLEGLNSDAVVEIIQRFIPQAAELTTIFLMSCYSDSCLNGKSSLVQEVKARFEHFVDVVGYKGRVNVDNDGNPEIVTNDRPGMAPSDIDSLKQKADELDQQLEKLTDKMEEIITAQSQALDNI
ncbi:C80 family cysteine peptidase, partial [bacterium endosymbiont of Bathymodiolus sp. 5 South]|uniref:C80 family cysteine peptidase n=1 Tax=bacterium endosymbiont of Bathymodiolus sp. 5 South TaxID=1181670 RepID=UPI00214B73DE